MKRFLTLIAGLAAVAMILRASTRRRRAHIHDWTEEDLYV